MLNQIYFQTKPSYKPNDEMSNFVGVKPLDPATSTYFISVVNYTY